MPTTKPMPWPRKPASKPGTDGASTTPLTAEQLWSRLLAWQTRREHSRLELARKLAALGADEDQQSALLARLADLGLQSDARHASQVVRSQLARGRGLRVLQEQLREKGLSADEADVSEQLSDIDWVERAFVLLQRRASRRDLSDPREQARQLRFLQYRGFTQGQALQAWRKLLSHQNGASRVAPDS